MAKKKYVIADTNIIIEIIKNKEEKINLFKQIGEGNIYISSITTAELYFGAIDKKERTKIKSQVDKLKQIPLNEKIDEIFIESTPKSQFSPQKHKNTKSHKSYVIDFQCFVGFSALVF